MTMPRDPPRSLMFVFALLLSCCWWIDTVSAACGDDYNLNYHAERSKLDICSIEDTLSKELKMLTNWGNRPVWIDNDRFIFLSNTVSDIYMFNIPNNTITLLTDYSHSGFCRLGVLPNKDLLVHGPSTGPQPPRDPLKINQPGTRFTADMFIIKGPNYNEKPIPLNVHAWEGIAVSAETNRIVWSDTASPFFGSNIIETFFNYLLAPSNLWTGFLEYDANGNPSITQQEIILSKCWFFCWEFYEVQNFRGANDQEVLFNAYGPTAEGSSDMLIYNFEQGQVSRLNTDPLGYNEWEGVHPDYSRSFFERAPDASRFSGPTKIDMYLWDFASQATIPFSIFRREDNFDLANCAFSPDATVVLCDGDSDARLPDEQSTPGYAVGIVMIDYALWLQNPVPFT